MKINPYRIMLIASAAALANGSAVAADIRIDGFASIYYGQALDKDELGSDGEFMGYDDQAEFQSDSLYGIQFRSDLAEKLSATGQLVGRGDKDYKADITWAYFTYQFTNDWALKVGRQRVPYFLYSDYLDVAYAYTWITPPDSNYELGGFDNIDGANLEYVKLLGNWTSRLNMVYGSSDTDVTDNTGTVATTGTSISLSAENFWDVTWNLNYNDWFTVQLNYSSIDVTISAFNDLADGIEQFIPFLTAEQNDYLRMDEDTSSYAGLALSADFGSWFAVTEYVKGEIENAPIRSDNTNWYVMGGFRLDKWTFALTYSEIDAPNSPDTVYENTG
ncbi:MAG: hypothetical protein D6160_04045 [Ketobacter sp.]|nr:MAG: hypothetical protein D6160_04045 [Ketobacter sp.]